MFKVGDVVRRTGEERFHGISYGDVAIVTKVRNTPKGNVAIELKGHDDIGFNADFFELVTSAKAVNTSLGDFLTYMKQKGVKNV